MKKRFLSLILVLAMMVGVFTPLMALANNADEPVEPPTGKLEASQLSDTKPEKTKINIFKLTTKQSYKNGAPWKHTGGKIADTKILGTDVNPLAGAKFTFYKITVKVVPGTTDTTGKEAKTQEEADKLMEKYLNILKAAPKNFEKAETMNQIKTNGYSEGGQLKIPAGVIDLATGDGLYAENKTDPKQNKGETINATDAQGLVTVSLPDGYYWAVESVTPAKVTGSIAVPFGLTLPLMNGKAVGDAKAGSKYLKEIYIYPKNIQTDNVQIDKDHANYDEKTGKWLDKDGKEVPSTQLGLDYTNYQRDKKTISEQLGKDRPFQSGTVIPRNYTFNQFTWTDTMSEGLTYNKNLVVTIDYTDADGKTVKENQPFIDMTKDPKENAKFVTERDNGYDVKVKKDQVKTTLVEYLKRGPVTFHFKYSAKVNNNAAVDKPQSNSITYIPKEPNGVPDINSKDSKIKINKSWKKNNADVTSTASDLTYYVEDENGKTVASVTVKSDATAGTVIQAANGIKFTVGANFGSGTFEGLPEGSYKVREAVNGYLPTYKLPEAVGDAQPPKGEVNIINEDNPDVKKPKEPKVIFHGKKFVKCDQMKNEDRLFGAEFVIRNKSTDDKNPDKGKFLVVKSADKKVEEITDVKNAKKALDDEIAKYNALNAQQQTAQKATYDTNIDKLQKAYNDAVIKSRTEYTWVEGTAPVGKTDKSIPPADAYKLVSDGQGRFEITGLYAGKYELVEITAPVGYAKLETPVEFEVKEGSYTKDESDHKINYKKEAPQVLDAFRVDNKKVTIPQTGGIGTIIFTVVGLAIMGSAIIAIKKRQAAEAR